MDKLNPGHPMSQFAEENAVKFIACMIWKLRAYCPNLSVELTTQDMSELANVFARDAVVAFRGGKDSITLQLVDQRTGEALVADPALDENSPNAVMMGKMMEARKRAPAVADLLLQYHNVSVADVELMEEAADILKLLTWEPEE